jgi:hypothetical protein
MAKNKHLSGNLFTKTPLTIRETSLSARIAEYLNAKGIYHDRLNCGMVKTSHGKWLHLCKTGTPDRFAIVRGYIVFIEVKKQGEKPTPEQINRHEELRKSGAIVLVVDTYEGFIKEFSAINGNLNYFNQKEKKENAE